MTVVKLLGLVVYSHAKDFHLFNVLDALLGFPVVAIANGLLYPRFGLDEARPT